jgi:heme o synthase
MINYYLLTKPKIIMGNLITIGAGFLLASKGTIDLGLFLATMLGLILIIAAACVFNNYLNRYTDSKMKRTQKRALATGLISGRSAILFAICLQILGNLVLLYYTNLLTLAIADFGFFVYVVLYSLWKCKTIYGTAIGSISGAVPPVIGYCAVSNQLDLAAAILFLMMLFWQMPHFFSIAMYHFEDYAAAEIPVLPVEKGPWRTKVHMLLYIMGFILASMLLTLYGYTGYLYLSVAMVSSAAWLLLCVRGFKSQNDQQWARGMFQLSLLVITAVCLVMPVG